MNILYYSVHQILEDDECRLFQQLGHNVICLGANGKNGSVQAFRPAIEFSPAEVALYDKFAELGGKFVYGADITSTIIPADFMDFIDVTVVMHDPQFIARFWDTISAKPVVWRTIGQGIDMIDAALLPHRAAGLKIVRYSPMEQNFAGNIGQDALIRFGKSSEVYSGWVGDTAQVLTFANFFSHRYPLDFADYCKIVSGLPAALGGGGNDGVANAIGTVSWDKQIELLQRSRAYLYASGGHIPYTLNFMEAWITGIPVVVYSPKERQGEFFEIDRMIENGVDGYICRSIEEARYWLSKLLEDESLAARIGRAGRLSALKLFGEEAAAQAWQAFFASLSVDAAPRRPIQKMEVAAVQSETKRVFDALALLRPFDIDLEKMYIGNERDGGYVLADSPAADTDVISFGVGPDVTFEVEMAERGHRVFLHDHTVEGVPQHHDRFVFRKVGVCGQRQEGGELTSLDHCLEMAGPLSDRLILKMDIEGWEWDVFSSISPATLARFDQIVLEIHWLEHLAKRDFEQKVSESLKRITQQFTLFHVHANNCANICVVHGLPVASVLEISFVRTSLVKRRPSRTVYPSILNKANHPHFIDHALLFYPFLPTAVEPERVDEVLTRMDLQYRLPS